MNFINNYEQLGYAVALQAARDYETASPGKRRVILKELRSDYMQLITNGLSIHLADALKKDHQAVLKRIKNMEVDIE